jgi:hypothetical protein
MPIDSQHCRLPRHSPPETLLTRRLQSQALSRKRTSSEVRFSLAHPNPPCLTKPQCAHSPSPP